MMASGEIRLIPTMPRRMPVLAQSQTSSDGLQEITVTAQSLVRPPPALFSMGTSTFFFAPSGTSFQAIQQAGRQFAAGGGKLADAGQFIGRNGKFNFQLDSDAQGLGYEFYQEASNYGVGAFLEGFFDGSLVGYLGGTGSGQAYAAGLVGGTASTNWSYTQALQWQRWWTAGWNAVQSGNYPVQIGSPVQWPAPFQ